MKERTVVLLGCIGKVTSRIGHVFAMVEGMALAAITIALALIVFYGTMVRYLPIAAAQMIWTEEVARLLLVWVAFWGVSLVQREDAHFRVDFLVKAMGSKLRFYTKILTDLILLTFVAVLIKEAFSFTKLGMVDVTPALGWPSGLFSLPLLCGSVLMAIYIGVGIAFRFKRSS